ncbi:hypothetical protein ABB27_09330 [Stenotrophomonas terrae]|uniref:Uncharacterized protein n=1 Tax=Stenotrophomonas terrae TaxID=405446 RepID=A0A0R0CNT3_9GAMM|nr:hypothetical protein [Stenotrophomonas terrae]KRG67527.1 hypothetical protein ABB27_09330 [Stenotrophomonas terrae]
MPDNTASATGFIDGLLINDIDQCMPATADLGWMAGVGRIAQLARGAGGFIAFCAGPLVRSRIQFTGIADVYNARRQVLRLRNELIGLANTMNPKLVALGGGCKDIAVYARQTLQHGAYLEVDLIVDVPNRSDANILDSMLSRMAPLIEQLTLGTRNRTSISDIADQQLLCAQVAFDAHCFALAPQDADALASRIVDLHRHICTTPGLMRLHNAGVVKAVNSVLAAITPAATDKPHCRTAQSDHDAPLCIWYRDHRGRLCGRIALPLITGLVEHDERMPAMSRTSSSVHQLNHAVAAIGLAQSLASLHADASDAIALAEPGQHAHDVALLVGARGDEVAKLVNAMVQPQDIRCDHAIDLLDALQSQ